MKFTELPNQQLNIEVLRKRSGDAKARKLCIAELERHDRLAAMKHRLGDMRYAAKAIDDLKAEGIKLPAALVEAGIHRWEEKARAMLQEAANELLCADLSERVGPDLKRCLRNTIKELEADVETMEASAKAIAAKYGFGFESGQVAASLRHAVRVFQKELDTPFSTAWSQSQRSALGMHFTDPL